MTVDAQGRLTAVDLVDVNLHPPVTLVGQDYLTLDQENQQLSAGLIDLTQHVTGTLPVGSGGTGVTALSDIIGTSNQVSVLNGGSSVIGSNVTLSLPQDIHTAASPTFDNLTLSSLNVSGSTTLNNVAYNWPGSDGSNNHVLTTDSSGNLSWKSIAGSGGMVYFTLSDGTNTQRIDDANTLLVQAAGGLSAVVAATDKVTISLNDTAVTGGSYGSASAVATFTVNAKGQLTAAVTTSIAIDTSQITSGTLGVNRGGTGVTALSDIIGTSNQVSVLNGGSSVIGSNVTLSLPQDIHSGASPTFDNLTLTTLNVSGDTTLNGVAYSWPVADGSSDYVLTTDSAGNLSWQSVTGAGGMSSFTLSDGTNTQTIEDANTLLVLGSGGLSSAVTATDTVTITLDDTTVTGGSYGSASAVATFTVNAKGQLTAAGTTSIAIDTSQITSGTLGVNRGGTGVTALSDIIGTSNQVSVLNGGSSVIGSNVTLSLPQDRGQGFLSSLKRVKPDLSNHHEALLTAMTTIISGRTPERRGRGLKFVTEAVNDVGHTHLLMYTGNARLECVAPIKIAHLADNATIVNDHVLGTYMEIVFNV